MNPNFNKWDFLYANIEKNNIAKAKIFGSSSWRRVEKEISLNVNFGIIAYIVFIGFQFQFHVVSYNGIENQRICNFRIVIYGRIPNDTIFNFAIFGY